MKPSGTLGRAFGVLMEWINTRSYWAALQILSAGHDEHILEIGFGTGRFAELVLDSNSGVRVAGVDPTETMVNLARVAAFKSQGHAPIFGWVMPRLCRGLTQALAQ